MEGPAHGRAQRVAGSKPYRLLVASGALGAMGLAACGSSPTLGDQRGNTTAAVIQVVAAENTWGSIAGQLGGDHVHVTSIITNPTTDPHSYEPTAGDAQELAMAQFVVVNGIGYDPWAPRLVAADQTSPTVLHVGKLLGVPAGGNPHRWYNPGDVHAVVNQIVTDLQKLDPKDRSYFSDRRAQFLTVGLNRYEAAIRSIRSKFAGTAVGASESIFAMLAPALGLRLITPYSFLKAISEGTDVSAADKETIDSQIKNHRIRIYVCNSQNVTPDVEAQLAAVKAEHIPTATITETLSPAHVTYEAWQTKQLLGIEAALNQAVGLGR